MQTLNTIVLLRAERDGWRKQGLSVALVPTMGNLHAGHIALVERALTLADRVVVTIFVNPLQFGAGEDLDAYPRTLQADQQKLIDAGAHLLFAPSEREIYPRGRNAVTYVDVPELTDTLCGASRPGHFRGVTTVVAKLFNLVQPELALFGEKDYQQLMVIKRMVADLDFPVEIHSQPIVREADGLAMSSRNGYLSIEQRRIAPRLQAIMQQFAARVRGGEEGYAALSVEACEQLAGVGLRCDYFEFRHADDLSPAEPGVRPRMILAAAYLDGVRLIDNLMI